MSRIRLPYIQTLRDKTGPRKVRHYFRRPGFKRVALPGLPGSPEFMAAYAAAMAGDAKVEVSASRTKAGTINELVVAYYRSSDFTSLADLTRSTYRNLIEKFRAEHGDKPVKLLERRHVKKMVEDRAATPSQANHFRSLIGLLMRFAVYNEWRDDDPTLGVRKIKVQSGGYHTWTEAEVATFEARHPVSTKARLALDLLLCTGQRRSDVVRMGPPNVERIDGEDWISFRQQKTGTPLSIPIHPKLAASLAATPTVGLRTFLVTEYGKPFAPAGFGNWFRDRCNEAGLPQCSAHGLRKTMATRIADADGNGFEVKAMTGHRNLAEVDTYTRAASQRGLARAAMDKLIKAGK